MPNLGLLLKQEIARLARKEIRSQVEPLRKASVQTRRQNAALKLEVKALERQLAQLRRQARSQSQAVSAEPEPAKIRFVAKGLRSHRKRLGLSAADFGRLIGVSGQSVYNWEQGHATPRREQLEAIAALRKLGKRAATQRLDEAGPSASTDGRAAKRRTQAKSQRGRPART